MRFLENFNFDLLDPKSIFDEDNVFIDICKPDRSFKIEGNLIEGRIPNNLVLESDKICLRYSFLMRDFIDVECYGNGRMAWFRLNLKQFAKIKYYLAFIQ